MSNGLLDSVYGLADAPYVRPKRKLQKINKAEIKALSKSLLVASNIMNLRQIIRTVNNAMCQINSENGIHIGWSEMDFFKNNYQNLKGLFKKRGLLIYTHTDNNIYLKLEE